MLTNFIKKNLKSVGRFSQLNLKSQLKTATVSSMRGFYAPLILTSFLSVSTILQHKRSTNAEFFWWGSKEEEKKEEEKKEEATKTVEDDFPLEELRQHRDYKRIIGELRLLIRGAEGSLRKVHLEKITRLVVLIGADDFINNMIELRNARCKNSYKDPKYLNIALDMALKKHELVKEYLEVILEDLNLNYSDWLEGLKVFRGKNYIEINPLGELENLYYISEKHRNVTRDQMTEIYQAQIELLEKNINDEKFYELVKDAKRQHNLSVEEASHLFIDLQQTLTEDMIINRFNANPGDGIYSGFSRLKEYVDYEMKLENLYAEMSERFAKSVESDIAKLSR